MVNVSLCITELTELMVYVSLCITELTEETVNLKID